MKGRMFYNEIQSFKVFNCLQNRPAGGVTGQKVMFAQDHPPIDKLADIVKQIKPTAIIG